VLAAISVVLILTTGLFASGYLAAYSVLRARSRRMPLFLERLVVLVAPPLMVLGLLIEAVTGT
jgi:hypothetical protein